MNLDSETRNGFFISSKAKKIWLIELELVKELLRVCNKYNLSIWADGGTLLGTIREHGFIPWDDDIDMCMMRKDYDKLVELAPHEFKSPYFFQTAYTDIDYPHGHAQLRKDGTTAILPFDINSKYHQGIFIDIFVYDAIPSSDLELNELRKRSQLMNRNINAYCYGFSFSSWLKNPVYNFCFIVYIKKKIRNFGYANYFKTYEDLFRKYNIQENEKVGAIEFCFDRNVNHNLKKIYFSETIWKDFENIKLPVPVMYHEMLKSMYGDYMTPTDAPSLHGGFLVLDPERSYTEYLPELRKKYKKERWKGLFKKIINKI